MPGCPAVAPSAGGVAPPGGHCQHAAAPAASGRVRRRRLQRSRSNSNSRSWSRLSGERISGGWRIGVTVAAGARRAWRGATREQRARGQRLGRGRAPRDGGAGGGRVGVGVGVGIGVGVDGNSGGSGSVDCCCRRCCCCGGGGRLFGGGDRGDPTGCRGGAPPRPRGRRGKARRRRARGAGCEVVLRAVALGRVARRLLVPGRRAGCAAGGGRGIRAQQADERGVATPHPGRIGLQPGRLGLQPGSMRLQPGCTGLQPGSTRLQLGRHRKSRTTRCGGPCLWWGPRCVSGASGASRGLADTGAPASRRPASRPSRSQAGKVSEGDRSPPAPRPWAGRRRAARAPRAQPLAAPRAPEKTSELSTPAAGQDGPGLGAGACRGPRLRSLHARSCPRPAARRRARPRG